MPEGLSAVEVGKEIAEHREHASEHARARDLVTIAEAVMLSVVAMLAAWSGYSAAKWGTESSLALAKASASRTKANLATTEAVQLRTLDSVNANAVLDSYESGDHRAFRLAIRRMRPGYRSAFQAWIALHPLKDPDAPRDPSVLPQYRIPQEAVATRQNRAADEDFAAGQSAAGTADSYVRITVFLAAVLFIVGISSHFSLRSARWGLIGVGFVLLVTSVVQLLSLPGPP